MYFCYAILYYNEYSVLRKSYIITKNYIIMSHATLRSNQEN